ncbi:MAG: XRE family transcriptional regulator [Alphaproteobacteria bacterium]|nr:MAG: XRE family transcriptional regulator [Alphaproteobacteria bacterium]
MKNLRLIFGLGVHRRRKALGWTQAQLAERVELSADGISQIERGKIAASFDTIGALAEALDVHPAELFGGLPLVPGKRHLPLTKIVERLRDATPAQLKKIGVVVNSLLDD